MMTSDSQSSGRGRPGSPGAGRAREAAGTGPERRIRTHRELPSGRAVVGALLVSLAAVATYLVARGSDRAPSSTFVVATRELAPGDVLEPSDLAVVALDLPPAVAAAAFEQPHELHAAVTRGPVAAGSLLTTAVVAIDARAAHAGHDAVGSDALGRDAAGDEPGGAGAPAERYREVSFAVPSARALMGDLEPGDRVDVVSTFDARTTVVVQRAVVLAASAGGDDAMVMSDEVVVTLALDDAADALAVAHGAAVGELTVLRSTRAGDELPEAVGATVEVTAPTTGAGA